MLRLLLVIVIILSFVNSFVAIPSASANIITVNADCTLVDAIIAANTDMPSGLCPAGSGADTIVLDVNVSLLAAYSGSTDIGGGRAGLPDITTDITIQRGMYYEISGNSLYFRIFNVMNGGSLTLDGVTVRDGRILGPPDTDVMGGGIYVDVGGSLALNNARLDGNKAESRIDMLNAGDASGGAIFNDGTIMSISGSFIINNTAQPDDSWFWGGRNGRGGGIYNRGTITSMDSSSIVSNVAIAGEGTEFGGFAYGGGIYNEGSITTISNSTVAQNSLVVAYSFAAVMLGGGIYNSGSIGSITSTDIDENQITNSDCAFPYSCDGSLYLQGGGIWSSGDIQTLSDVSMSRNIIDAEGQELYPYADSDISGGGFYNSGTVATLENCLIDENAITVDGGLHPHLHFYGGGLANFNTIQTTQNCSISSNSLTFYAAEALGDIAGGGLYNSGNMPTIDDVDISGNSIVQSTADPVSAIYVLGGAVYENGINTSISNSLIANNRAENYAASTSFGTFGGIYADGTGVSITNSTISKNSSSSQTQTPALAIATNDITTLTHVTVIENRTGPDADIINDFAAGTGTIVVGSLIGVTTSCPGMGSNNLAADPDNLIDCPAVFDGTFTIGTDVDATLQDNGGGTLTHALINHGGNPVIDGNPGCGLATDQRSFARDANCDIGAFEAGMLQNAALLAGATCNGPDLDITISSGDGLFNITASAGINMPVTNVGLGTTTIIGPEKWDNVTVTETSGDTEAINLGQFKCRSDERPVPLIPAHRSHTTDTTPIFSWMGITDANNYRVFVFDDASPATRTVDIRQNSGGPTTLTLATPLSTMRLFWRVRGRQNRVWSLWSIRFTLFVDAVMFAPNVQHDASLPTVDAPPIPLPTIIAPPNDRNPATLPPPPNSR